MGKVSGSDALVAVVASPAARGEDRREGHGRTPGRKSSRYQATRATAASGLYDLTVEHDGQLAGASAAGVGLTSVSELHAPRSGRLRSAD